MDDVKFNKILIFVNSLVPVALLGWDAWYGRLGPNPIEFFLRTTGVLTLVFLLITLAVSPIRELSGWNWIIKFRRMIGLYAFFYGIVHLITYLVFDRGWNFSRTVTDVLQRPFIAIGMASFLLLTPLAVTSTNKMIKLLGGKRWQRLHRLVYVAAAGGVIHFWMIVKSDIFWPAVFGLILIILLGYRAVKSKTVLKLRAS